jgi:hypothetical protein
MEFKTGERKFLPNEVHVSRLPIDLAEGEGGFMVKISAKFDTEMKIPGPAESSSANIRGGHSEDTLSWTAIGLADSPHQRVGDNVCSLPQVRSR